MLKNWIQKFLAKKPEELKKWRTNESIFKFISNNVGNDGKLVGKADDLPDEIRDDAELKFAPGLMDAMFGIDNDSETSKNTVNQLVHHLKLVASKGDKKSEQAFYNLITEDEGVIGNIDNFLEAIAQERLPIEPYLFSFAADLATKTDKRNAVKFGIALLGLCMDKSVLDKLKILGLHDEFTVYTAIAILNLTDNAVTDLWELAKKVDGWGKIQLIDILVDLEISDEIRDWLLIEGYKNYIMHEYLAYTCAMEGLLHEKLEHEQIDKTLFKASGEIIEALIKGGPAEDISDYTHASSVVENFLRHAAAHTSDISDFILLNDIEEFLTELHKDVGEHKNNGWTQDIISNCLIKVAEIINKHDWKPKVVEALKSKDRITYWKAKQAAENLGIDLWETVWQRLLENPVDSESWRDVTHHAKPDNVDQIIDFALKSLPLAELSSGPKDMAGFGPDYPKFVSLEYATTFLEDYPKKGEKILLTAINCPVTRNRNMAIHVLDKWTRKNWSDDIEKAILQLIEIEPNNETKGEIERLLNKR